MKREKFAIELALTFHLFLAEIPRVEAFQAEPLGALLPAFAHDLSHACSLHPGDLETLQNKDKFG